MDLQTKLELLEDLGIEEHELIDVDALSHCSIDKVVVPRILTQVRFKSEPVDNVFECSPRSPELRSSTPPNNYSRKRKASESPVKQESPVKSGRFSQITLSQPGRADTMATVRIKEADEDGIFDFTQTWPSVNVPTAYKGRRFGHQFIREALNAEKDSDSTLVKHNYSKEYPVEQDRRPFAIFNHVLNPDGPEAPGLHGCVFLANLDTLNDGTPVDDIELFMRRGISKASGRHWEYCGTYSVGRVGELSVEQVAQLPPDSRRRWAAAICSRSWGQDFLDQTNARLAKQNPPKVIPKNIDAIHKSIVNGDIQLKFSVMQCIGFNKSLYGGLCKRAVTTGKKKKNLNGKNSKDPEEESQKPTEKETKPKPAKRRKFENLVIDRFF